MKDYPKHRDSLLKTLPKYREVIALPGGSSDATDKGEHNMKFKPETKAVYIRTHRLPHIQRQILVEQVKDMLKQGVIHPLHSPWNSTPFLVPKRNGQIRPVIDFRKVIEVAEDDRYPLLVLNDLLMSLRYGNRVFSSLDLGEGVRLPPGVLVRNFGDM